ncbi:MAG: glycosyltransferase family 39 protein [Ktedonobacteraceae bacterium]
MDVTNTILGARKKKTGESVRIRVWRMVVSWLLTWEIYPILVIATFLRFYQWPMTQFDADQAVIYGLARNALVHGLIPITTNTASIGIMNPPATVYLLMLGAVFSANPYAGLIVVGFLNVLAVLLTYVIVRRYFGRMVGTFSALFYAVALRTVIYSRFIWNQNMLAPFVLLFLLALLWGVMERRRGWLAPSVLLWGWMIQLHGSAVFLAIPLVLACVLAFKTLRWRDVFLSVILLVLIYFPYIIWEVGTHFSDVSILLQNVHSHASLDKYALDFYLSYFRAFDFSPPAEPGSWGFKLFSMLHWDYRLMLLLLTGSYAFALFAVCQSRWSLLSFMRKEAQLPTPLVDSSASFPVRLLGWWHALLASPARCTLLLLLTWQILPVLVLTRHSIDLYAYYLLILMPGPFILMGIFTAQVVEWLRQCSFPWSGARYAVSLLLVALIVMQFIGTFAWIQDDAQGFHPNGNMSHSLGDLQNALAVADHLAQNRHLHRIYIDTNFTTVDAFNYLAPQMQTPYTLLSINDAHCLLLPDISQGPSVMLFSPAQQLDEALLTHFASAALVSEPSYVGGPPFRLYIVQPLSLPQSQATFVNTLALDTSQSAAFTWQDPHSLAQPPTHLLTTFWTSLSSRPAQENTTYTYRFSARSSGRGTDSQNSSAACSFTHLDSGEQLLVPFVSQALFPVSLAITGSVWMTSPHQWTYGPFHLEDIRKQSSLLTTFQSASGGGSIIVQH